MRDLVDQMGGGRGAMPRGDDEEPAQKSDLVELTLALHYDTGRAVLVSETGEELRAVFLPHSQIEIVKENRTVQGKRRNGQGVVLPVVTVTVPEWLAKEKGLV